MKISNRNIVIYALFIVFVCIAYGVLQAVSFQAFVSFSFARYVLCGTLDAVYLFGLSFLLWKVVKYGNFKALEIRKRYVNYFLLGLLFMAVWQMLSIATMYIVLGESKLEEILSVSKTKAILASLIYPIIVFSFQTLLNRQKIVAEPINEEADEEADEIAPQQEVPENAPEAAELEKLERIAVRIGTKINVITIPEVVYFQAEGDYVRIFTDTGKFLKEDTLKFYQLRLPETEFVRVHRSYLVNVTKILRIELYEKQSQQLTLSNGDKLRISASGYKRLREVLGL
jgi:hypothetical protein